MEVKKPRKQMFCESFKLYLYEKKKKKPVNFYGS